MLNPVSSTNHCFLVYIRDEWLAICDHRGSRIQRIRIRETCLPVNRFEATTPHLLLRKADSPSSAGHAADDRLGQWAVAKVHECVLLVLLWWVYGHSTLPNPPAHPGTPDASRLRYRPRASVAGGTAHSGSKRCRSIPIRKHMHMPITPADKSLETWKHGADHWPRGRYAKHSQG